MSYLTDTFFAVKCDNCGTVHEDFNGISYWSDKEYALTNVEDADWLQNFKNHYCPDCYSFDDDDNLLINKTE